jgi:hypothetical protein
MRLYEKLLHIHVTHLMIVMMIDTLNNTELRFEKYDIFRLRNR